MAKQKEVKTSDESQVIKEPAVILDINELEGKIIALSDAAVLWRTNSGSIDLSHFTGDISYKITKETTEADLRQIFMAIKTGRLVVSDTEVKGTPAVNLNIDHTLLARINIFLDEKNMDTFYKNVNSTHSASFLKVCYEVEQSDRKRARYLEILSARLGEI